MAMRRLVWFLSATVILAQGWGSRPPRVISRVEPEYSAEARRAGVNTTLMMSLLVDEEGVPRDIKVVRGAGFGLDEMAVRAIETWRFEPGTKEGKPFATTSHVELRLQILNQKHTGQTARLNFSLPQEVSRPQLIKGEIPANPDPLVDASMRVRFTVGADGRPRGFQTLSTNNQQWTERALVEMSEWRFSAAMRGAEPEEASGVFELAVGAQTQDGHAPGNGMVTIWPPEPQDVSLEAPRPLAPPDHAIFDGYPRRVTCKWEAVAGAYSYLLEWDYMYQDTWNAEYQGMPGMAMVANRTEATFVFAGEQAGRWRVWPVNSKGKRGHPSEWRTFRYLR